MSSEERHRSNCVYRPAETKTPSSPTVFCPPHKSRAYDSAHNPTSFRCAFLNRALPHRDTRQILLRQNCLTQTGLPQTGIVFSTAASSTVLLVSQDLTTARDDMLQDGALTTVHTLSVFHIAGHSATLADVQIPPSTSSAELRDGHTKIPKLELQEDGSRGRSAAKFLSTVFSFAGRF
ncbi:hypothetical protein F5888DRAFT_1125611 [Russula emetica]|nr:hypothetical protein F5888DRAFT_1125611 [Russula emetica]